MIAIHKDRCPQNHRCPLVSRCPADAISQSGFGLPVIAQERCLQCGLCVDICPTGAVAKTIQ
ncbi:MAG: 4Fe-4S binding protein [Spirochaetes bacterium]|nr:4Fe-4S binding protein [Spirochaetota bacterium]